MKTYHIHFSNRREFDHVDNQAPQELQSFRLASRFAIYEVKLGCEGQVQFGNVSSDKTNTRSLVRETIRPLKQAASSKNDRSHRSRVCSVSHLLKISKASDRPTLIFDDHSHSASAIRIANQDILSTGQNLHQHSMIIPNLQRAAADPPGKTQIG